MDTQISNGFEWLQTDSVGSQIILGIIIVIVIYILVAIISYTLRNYLNIVYSRPMLINGKRSASVSKTIMQHPKYDKSTLLRRSINEKNGIEFTYMTWINIDDWESQSENWKHILHKGPYSSKKIQKETEPHNEITVQCPGMWLHPDKNSIRVYINTFEKHDEFIDIPNIPIKKWFHIAVVLSHRNLDVYINGFLRKRIILKSVPKQNYYNLHITQNGGFNGHLSNLQYYNFAIQMYQLNWIISKGPSKRIYENNETDDKVNIPYLHEKWWLNDKL